MNERDERVRDTDGRGMEDPGSERSGVFEAGGESVVGEKGG